MHTLENEHTAMTCSHLVRFFMDIGTFCCVLLRYGALSLGDELILWGLSVMPLCYDVLSYDTVLHQSVSVSLGSE